MDVCVFTDEISSDFEEALSLAKAAGADSVELRGGLYGYDVTTVPDEVILDIRAALGRYGLRVACIGSPFGKCHHDRPNEVMQSQAIFGRMMALGSALGCRLIRCFAFWNPASADPLLRAPLTQYLAPVMTYLDPVVLQAEAGGFIFGLEMGSETLVATAEEVLLLYRALGNNPAFRVVWDIHAEWAAGDIPFPYGYEMMRDLIAHVHVKPNRLGNMITVGDTDITYGEILVALRQDGFTGAASIEHWGSSDQQLKGVVQLRSAADAMAP